ncbi:MAG: class I SAM-dependent methyltransferase [Planctomycetales bacterium]|nr:class I SAM-dependent methyltransferase [Planctomycetales bacterium]
MTVAAEQVASNSYDDVPYPEIPIAKTHPDRLATVATIFGMEPASPRRCRVLELGCASGGNLMPLAESYPDSQFVGIDLSAKQIAEGQSTARELGLDNLDLRHLSITDVDADFGEFDYILCHGVYSWVPPEVQEKILEICRKNLAPQGIAYVSYNTYPGWHMRGMIRDMMLYHSSRFESPKDRVQQSRALLKFLSESVSAEGNAYGTMLKTELDNLSRQSGSYLFHEHLEEHNYPLYFHQFMERAAHQRLQYLGEVDVNTMVATNLPTKISETLGRIAPTILHTEQYLDFLKNRTFRQTLLCHQSVQLSRKLDGTLLENLWVASSLKPAETDTPLDEPGALEFVHPAGMSLESDVPLMKAALIEAVSRFPKSVSFSTLIAEAAKRLGQTYPTQAEAKAIGDLMIRCYTAGMIELSVGSIEFVQSLSERPIASGYARRQARKFRFATSRRQEVIPLNDVDRLVLGHLDGEHSDVDLANLLSDLLSKGQLSLKSSQSSETSSDEIRDNLPNLVNASLEKIAGNALLVG